MKKLLMLAVAAMAFAVPAVASANPVFTHNNQPITSGQKTVVFSGPAEFEVKGTGSGIHCSNVIADIDLEANGTGKVTSFVTNNGSETFCTTTEGLVAHTEATGPWTIHTNGHDTISITNVDIHNRITHPEFPVVIAERRLTGTFHATIPSGQTSDIHDLTLSGEGKVHIDETTQVDAVVSGTLTNTTDTQVGSATTGTG